MRKTLIWLDDMRNPQTWLNPQLKTMYEVVWLVSYDEFVDWINEHGLPAYISFDHDLGEYGEGERNGYTAAKFLVEYCIDNNETLPEYSCHSSNPAGRENILKLLSNFEKSYS